MKQLFLLCGTLLVSSCVLEPMFAVDVDEPVESAKLTLNGNSANMMKNVDGRYWAKWGGSDAGGSIDIFYPDGAVTKCEIGYVTHGHGVPEIQSFEVKNRKCEQQY